MQKEYITVKPSYKLDNPEWNTYPIESVIRKFTWFAFLTLFKVEESSQNYIHYYSNHLPRLKLYFYISVTKITSRTDACSFWQVNTSFPAISPRTVVPYVLPSVFPKRKLRGICITHSRSSYAVHGLWVSYVQCAIGRVHKVRATGVLQTLETNRTAVNLC